MFWFWSNLGNLETMRLTQSHCVWKRPRRRAHAGRSSLAFRAAVKTSQTSRIRANGGAALRAVVLPQPFASARGDVWDWGLTEGSRRWWPVLGSTQRPVSAGVLWTSADANQPWRRKVSASLGGLEGGRGARRVWRGSPAGWAA